MYHSQTSNTGRPTPQLSPLMLELEEAIDALSTEQLQ
jgi:hypothetical protein